jgi:hypothetical protein
MVIDKKKDRKFCAVLDVNTLMVVDLNKKSKKEKPPKKGAVKWKPQAKRT